MEKRIINRLKIKNFKRFIDLDISLSDGVNLFIGDNDSGKSTILLAIELVLNGNVKRVESVGFDNLFNVELIKEFLDIAPESRRFSDLPSLWIEIYLNEQNNPDLCGENNSEEVNCDGLRLELLPRNDLKDEVEEIIQNACSCFPFEYYSVDFKTFADKSYTSYSRYMNYLTIDNTRISNEQAMKSYIKGVYNNNVSEKDQNKHKYDYRESKKNFKDTSLASVNQEIEGYAFTVRNSSKSTLDNDLTISEDGVELENMGKGRQCFVRTNFALQITSRKSLDIVLLEEPENHLSHGSMKRLIQIVHDSTYSQILVATHSSMICSRLDLRKAILLNSSSLEPVTLKDLSQETADFFMKAPNTNILEFILSKKVILVEGSAEYILMENFYNRNSDEDIRHNDVHIISVGGISFKRYLELAQLLGIRTAVITDNDGNYQKNCIEKYSDYQDVGSIKIFSDPSDSRKTFEISMYEDNVEICNALFASDRRGLTVQEYMLANKSEASYNLLINNAEDLSAPEYINDAIQWIKE